jgi:tRNA (mo5U34)-methyltransferase
MRLARLDLPASLEGRTVLDVGAWDGFFSFEAERRGASRVVATDHYSWHGLGWGTGDGKAGFELARTALGSRVEDVDIDVMDLSPERVGTFDVVLFLGVLYHLRHPLLALERIASVADDLLVAETVVLSTCSESGDHLSPFIRIASSTVIRRIGGDRTTLRFTACCGPWGFSGSGPSRLRARRHTVSPGHSSTARIRQDRAVFHAWKSVR